MEIADLEYITLEGGGGKGAVYKGAIIALEKLFDKEWKNETLLKMVDGDLSRPLITEIPEPANVLNPSKKLYASILDYYNKSDSNLKIKGISGASAGAITAFPLSLGLNSEDINKILNSYPFNEEFLPNNELHEGKYRMVGMNEKGEAKILIAEDDFKKLGENNIKPFLFSANTKNEIGSNGIKGMVRGVVISEIVKIELIGLKNRLEPIKKLIEYAQKRISTIVNYSQKLVSIFLDALGFLNASQIDKLSGFLVEQGKDKISEILKKINIKPNRWKAFDLIPSNHMIPAIGNIIWDRGIYGGFEVRDFFYKILLMAISKDTHFKRELLANPDLLESIGVGAEKFKTLKLSFNERLEFSTSNDEETLLKLASLPEKLTFKKLFEINNINLCICVTNATSNQPIYFSNYFTPDFPVLEALGASMSFPIAFKPVYNEANVIQNETGTSASSGFVDFYPRWYGDNIYKETFKMSEYNYNQNLLLAKIKEANNLQISTNGNLSFRSFLPYLRRMIADNNFKNEAEKSMFYFYYNSAFKGLFIDGGVTNNLPTSIFTFTTDKTGVETQNLSVKKNVLSLKLDRSFPDEIKQEARIILESDKIGQKLLRDIPEIKESLKEKIAHYTFCSLLFKKLRLKKAFERNADLTALSKEVWIKIGKELFEEYRQTKKGFTPWNVQVNAISGLINSLQFGFDQGQIESIDDNENIIPLYCYGIGTLDFDLTAKDMVPLVEMAVKAGEAKVIEYFKLASLGSLN